MYRSDVQSSDQVGTDTVGRGLSNTNFCFIFCCLCSSFQLRASRSCSSLALHRSCSRSRPMPHVPSSRSGQYHKCSLSSVASSQHAWCPPSISIYKWLRGQPKPRHHDMVTAITWTPPYGCSKTSMSPSSLWLLIKECIYC